MCYHFSQLSPHLATLNKYLDLIVYLAKLKVPSPSILDDMPKIFCNSFLYYNQASNCSGGL